MFVILFIVYLGRIFTRFDGVASGKAYFTTIITFGLIRILIEVSTASVLHIEKIYVIIYNFISYLYVTFDMSTLFICILLLSTFGELFLSIIPFTSTKSHFGLMEAILYPPNAEILDSREKIKNKLKMIINLKEIKIIKCFSESLWLAEEACLIDGGKSHIRVVKPSDDLVAKNIVNNLIKKPITLDLVLNIKNKRFNIFFENYNKRLSYLSTLENVEIKTSYIGNLRFVIVEYMDGNRCMILFGRDTTGFRGTAIGLYSDEFQDVEKYLHVFDNTWYKS